jgi:predicted O-methyltransferase YrrM
VYSRYDHDKYHTFIFPEEERIAYALAYILHPTSAILLGSYYGYWGIWIMPAICERGGMAYFVDSNESVSVVAANNLNKLGYDKNSEVIICEGTNFLSNIKQQYDFVALDAEGDSTHPNPDFRGKAVYYPLIKACFEHITNGSVVLCHNILLRNPIQDPYFMRKIDKNLSEFSKFLPFMKNNFRQGLDYSTTEGIGIYRK